MNIRIHSFKVYLIETLNGSKYWSFRKPFMSSSRVLRTEKLWDLLYLAREGAKTPTGKSLVRKDDLEFLLTELVGTNGLKEITTLNN